MTKPFDNLTLKNKEKLINLLEAHSFKFEKNKSILKTFSENIIGIILKGSVEIIKEDYTGDRVKIEELKKDDIISYTMLIINNDDYEIITKEETEILIIDYDILKKIKPDKIYLSIFLKNLFMIMSENCQKKNERIHILAQKTIRNKLLEYFKIESKKRGIKTFYIESTFTNLANYLAVDRSAMSRELKYLKNEKFIEIKGKRIKLLY